jgi:hypothetical protein
MNVVLASKKLTIKSRNFKWVLIYAYAKQYMPDLEKTVRYFDSDPNINVSKEIGKYQIKKTGKKRFVITN